MGSSQHRELHELRTLVKDYLVTDDYPDGWIEPDEISDAGAPDLILARELWRLIDRLQAAEQARDARGDDLRSCRVQNERLEEQCDDAKQKLDDTGQAAIREARRCDDFRKRYEEKEREWAVESDRTNGLQEQYEVALEASRLYREEVAGLREQLQAARVALRQIEEFIEGRHKEGDTEYQVALTARAVLYPAKERQ